MKKSAQIEDILLFFVIILVIFSGLTYYFYFKTGKVPVFRPKKEITPAEKGVVPRGLFFPQEKLPFLPLSKKTYAQTSKEKFKPNNNIETFIYHRYKDLNSIENNVVEFYFDALNYKNPFDKFYFLYFLYPLDKTWNKHYSRYKSFLLPKGYYKYVLIVTAVNKDNEFDPTFAYLPFTTKVSPYFKDVSLNPRGDKMTLFLNNHTNKMINITKWKIISSTGIYEIPQGVEVINPISSQYQLKDIILQPYGQAKIIATTSPIGFSFRANKCFRYFLNLRADLKKYIDFLYLPCDQFTSRDLLELRRDGYTIKCLDFLSKIPCSGPNLQNISQLDSKCLRLIDNIYSYNGCYQRKHKDNDFLLKNWFIFIEPIKITLFGTSSREVYKNFYEVRFEEIKLYDNYNLLVNSYVYY